MSRTLKQFGRQAGPFGDLTEFLDQHGHEGIGPCSQGWAVAYLWRPRRMIETTQLDSNTADTY
jgi:hypothetical protein